MSMWVVRPWRPGWSVFLRCSTFLKLSKLTYTTPLRWARSTSAIGPHRVHTTVVGVVAPASLLIGVRMGLGAGHTVEWGLVKLAGMGVETGPLTGVARSGVTLGGGAEV